jgi:hypothetical protein
LEKVVLLGIVDGNMNDHIWEVAPLLGIVEANRWKMASLGMLLFFFENIGLFVAEGPHLLKKLLCILGHFFDSL